MFCFFPFAWKKTHQGKRRSPPKQTNVSGDRSGEKGERYDKLNGNEGR